MPDNPAFLMVEELYRKMGLDYDGPPRTLPPDEVKLRADMLVEEVEELLNARDPIGQYDALLDLAVFTLGTVHLMGLPFQPGFNAVMESNFQKVPGEKQRGDSTNPNDLAKPEGWQPPEPKLKAIIERVAAIRAGEHLKELPKSTTRGEGKAPDPGHTPHGEKSGAQDEPVPGKALKYDDQKVPLHLLPAEALTEVAWGFGFGATKYGPHNWRGPDNLPPYSRTYSSIMRHLWAWWLREDIDEDSGLHHLALAACQLLILISYIKGGHDGDDRPQPHKQ